MARRRLPDKTGLYRLMAPRGMLLYVGISAYPYERYRQHSRTQPWFHLVDHWHLDWYPTRREALAAESQVIREDVPLFNIDQNNGEEWTWLALLDRRRFPILNHQRISVYAEAAILDRRLFDLLNRVQELNGCGDCAWPDIKAAAADCVGFTAVDAPVQWMREPSTYEAVISTLYESLPWTPCVGCAGEVA